MTRSYAGRLPCSSSIRPLPTDSDANLAYQNASLMAESLGVSQIYMGFVLTAARMGRKNAFARIAGITGRPQAIMALGIPAFRYSKYTER